MTNIETIHDAKEPSKDVKQLVDDIVYSLSENIGNQKSESITALITAHDDEIRRECDQFRMDELDAVMYSVDKWFEEGDHGQGDREMTNIETIHDEKEPSADAMDLWRQLKSIGLMIEYGEIIATDDYASASLIIAHDDAIRRECAEKVIPPIKQFLMVEESFNRYETEVLICRVQAAIIGKEAGK